jgi:hypothetical protein
MWTTVCGLILTVLLGWSWPALAGVAAGEADAAAKDKVLAAAESKGANNGGQEAALEEGKKEGKEEAQEDGCPATFGPLITDTAVPIETGKFAIQPTYGLSFVTKAFNDRGRRVSPGGNFGSFTMDHKITLGLWKNLEGFVVIPFQANWVNNATEVGPHGERAATQGGLGDLNLTLKYRLVEEGPKMPTITTLFATDFPTGRYKNLNPHKLGTDAIGGGAYVFTAGLNASKYLKPFIVYGNLWYSVQTEFRDDEGRVYPRDFITANLAAEYPFPFSKKWVALLELTSTWDTGRLFGNRPNTAPTYLLSILPGIEFMATESLSFALGLNIDLAGRNTDATVAPILSMVWAF